MQKNFPTKVGLNRTLASHQHATPRLSHFPDFRALHSNYWL